MQYFFIKEKCLMHLYKTALLNLTCNNGAGRQIQGYCHGSKGTAGPDSPCPFRWASSHPAQSPRPHFSLWDCQSLAQQCCRSPSSCSCLLWLWLTDWISFEDPGPPLRTALSPVVPLALPPAVPDQILAMAHHLSCLGLLTVVSPSPSQSCLGAAGLHPVHDGPASTCGWPLCPACLPFWSSPALITPKHSLLLQNILLCI